MSCDDRLGRQQKRSHDHSLADGALDGALQNFRHLISIKQLYESIPTSESGPLQRCDWETADCPHLSDAGTHHELLALDTRREIFKAICHNPGLSRDNIAEQTDLATATIREHAEKLEAAQLIESRKQHGKWRYYLPWIDDLDQWECALLAARQTPIRWSILVILVVRGGEMTMKELTDSLNRTRPGLCHHVGKLDSDDLLSWETDGSTYVRLPDRVHKRVLLLSIGGNVPDSGKL